MKQISLKMNSYASSAGIINNDMQKIALRAILWAFGILALCYFIILGNMVLNIVHRRSLETSMRSLSSEVQNLELNYLSISNNVDLPLSYSLGFKEIKATFATRKTLGLKPNSRLADSVAQNDI
jgi:hypothetical protein